MAGPFLQRTSRVGSYPPNAFGLYDMSGNVREWCSDWYKPSYFDESPIEDPKGPALGATRVARGGSWLLSAETARSASRAGLDPNVEDVDLGFRVVCEP
jgi:formylglycine-generating enzyme required for sulfatase activity